MSTNCQVRLYHRPKIVIGHRTNEIDRSSDHRHMLLHFIFSSRCLKNENCSVVTLMKSPKTQYDVAIITSLKLQNVVFHSKNSQTL